MKRLLAITLALMLLLTSALGEVRRDPGIDGYLPEEANINDSFITWACYDWFASTEIPEGINKWISFNEVAQKINDQMVAMLEQPQEDAAFKMGADYYHMLLDTETRTACGYGTRATGLVDAILGCNTIEELAQLIATDPTAGALCPFVTYYCAADEKDSTTNVLYISVGQFFL